MLFASLSMLSDDSFVQKGAGIPTQIMLSIIWKMSKLKEEALLFYIYSKSLPRADIFS